MTTHSNPDLEIIDELLSRLRGALAPFADRGPYALLDFPDYANVGDSLLWLGGRRILADVTGRDPAYVSCQGDHDDALLAQRLGARGTIFINGGGNTGDLWPHHQRFREHIVRTFPQHRVVQLPQSVYFGDRANERRAQSAFAAHPDFTLMVRDRDSLARAERLGAGRVVLAPDIAFGVGARERPTVASRVPVLVLARDDKEAGERSADLLDHGNLVVDWSDEGRGRSTLDVIAQLTGRPRLWTRLPMALRLRAYDLMARVRVEQGEALLAQGEFVRTDRLHAHIMCVLLGIPHEVADNSYGKVRALVEAWTRDATTLRGTRWSADVLSAV